MIQILISQYITSSFSKNKKGFRITMSRFYVLLFCFLRKGLTVRLQLISNSKFFCLYFNGCPEKTNLQILDPWESTCKEYGHRQVGDCAADFKCFSHFVLAA